MDGPQGELIVVGLGPGAIEQVTTAARECLLGDWPVLVRTARHPVVTALPEVHWQPLDDLYDTATDFDALYAAILDRLKAELAQGGDVVYAVPGHPLFAETTVRAALEAGLPARIVPGLSLLDAVATALRRDPMAEGWQLVDAFDLARALEAEPFAAGLLPVSPRRPALVCQVYNRRIASSVKLALMRVLPDDHLVTIVRAASVPGQEEARVLPLYEVDRAEGLIDHLTCLHVPAQAPLEALRTPETLAHITARLRAPGGCPWDREQTHHSLLPHVIEEAYEVIEAIERDDLASLAEELGDLLLQVVLHAQLAEEEGLFTFEDVTQAISAKLIRRHPHVFGDVSVQGSADVLRNWEAIKAAERKAKGAEETTVESVFAGIPRTLPALSRARTVQRRAGRAGATPAPLATLPDAVREELTALLTAKTMEARRARLGDLLFALVSLASHLDLDPEEALRAATADFQQRVEQESRVAASGEKTPS